MLTRIPSRPSSVAAVCVMPLVLTHLSRRNYPDVTMMGQNSFAVSLWNAIWVSMLFAVGWFLTLPFWLVPPLGFVVSIFWWTFAFSRMMRIDAIVEHATAEERRLLIQRLRVEGKDRTVSSQRSQVFPRVAIDGIAAIHRPGAAGDEPRGGLGEKPHHTGNFPGLGPTPDR